MPPSSTLSSKGQVTIPINVRHSLGVKSGDRVEFVQEDGRVVVRPAIPEENPFLEFVGILPAFNSVDEIVRYYRDLRDDDVPYPDVPYP